MGPTPDAHPWDPTPDAWDLTPDADVAEAEPCWQTLSKEVKPALSPSDVVASEVLGIFSYYVPSVYIHDIFGLTDRHIALDGDRYLRKFGKTDANYTYHTIQPDLLLKSGLNLAKRLARASNETYDEAYRTYELA